MSIWARYRNEQDSIEKIDDGNSAYLAREYQMAYGPEWTVWAGRKTDEPGRES